MKLTYIYHSGYAIEDNGITIIIDWWKDPADIIKHLLTNKGDIYVLATHFHPDHFNPQILEWKSIRPDIHYISSKDILRHKRAAKDSAVYMGKGAKYEDDNISIEAFGSTDIGVSWYIQVNGKKIFHAGDLNNWHWMDCSTHEEAVQYEKRYFGELKDIIKVVKELDLAMFPIDSRLGKEYMRGGRQFVERIHCKLFAPMHFTAKPISDAMKFKDIANEYKSKFFEINKEGDSIEF